MQLISLSEGESTMSRLLFEQAPRSTPQIMLAGRRLYASAVISDNLIITARSLQPRIHRDCGRAAGTRRRCQRNGAE